MSEIKLLPCPFCGAEPCCDCAEDHSPNNRDTWLVCCGTAFCYGNAFTLDNSFHNQKLACEAWNRRSAPKIWFAPTARRRYLTKRAAAFAEARARIKKKYPNEASEHHEGRMIDPGWNWRDLPRSEALLKRYARILMKAMK